MVKFHGIFANFSMKHHLHTISSIIYRNPLRQDLFFEKNMCPPTKAVTVRNHAEIGDGAFFEFLKKKSAFLLLKKSTSFMQIQTL